MRCWVSSIIALGLVGAIVTWRAFSVAVTPMEARPISTSRASADAGSSRGLGPKQYNPFHGVSRENIYATTSTAPTEPSDAVLLPTDDSTY